VKGRTVLITGATDGIGKQTALELARLGARVLVHGRNLARGEAVLNEVRRKTGNDQLELFIADLASLRQVRELAEAIRKAHDRLHVLINNAGVFMNKRKLTEDGLETTFAVNYLAPFLLTHLLLETLKRSAPARIINISSVAHQRSHVAFDNLQGEKRFDGYGAYALSKLGNILFTYELAERLQGTGVTANALHPGVITTKLLRAGFGSTGEGLEAGAETPVYLASATAVEGITGKYFVRKQAVLSAPATQDRNLRKKFWEVSERLAGIA